MRLDVFLKVSRLCPRRAVAQQLCDAGVVLLNGRPAKSAHTVKAGDVIKIARLDRELAVRVLKVPANRNVSRRETSQFIEVLSERVLEPLVR